MYNAAANGLAEAFSKMLCKLFKKVVAKSKRDWHENLREALWAYRTTYKMPTQSTPFALVMELKLCCRRALNPIILHCHTGRLDRRLKSKASIR